MVEYESSIKGKDVYKYHKLRVLQETLVSPLSVMNVKWVKDGDKASRGVRQITKKYLDQMKEDEEK